MPFATSRHGWRLALACLLAGPWLGQAAHAAPLLRPAAPTLGAEERARLDGDPHVMRWREARLAVDEVFDPSARDGPLALALFPDAELEARARSARTLGSGSRFLSGALAGGGRFALLRTAGGILRGEFHSAAGVFTMRSLGPRRVLVKQLDLSGLPPRCGLGAATGKAAEEAAPPSRPGSRRRHPAPASPATAPTEAASAIDIIGVLDRTVDVLVVYTPNAERSEGGEAQIKATIEAEVEKTNQAFINSGLSHRKIRFIAIKVDYTESTEDIADNLSYLYATKDEYDDPEGLLDEVHDLRKKYAADLVHLIVAQPVSTCGVATYYTLHEERDGQDFCADKSDIEACIKQWRKDGHRRKTFSVSAIPCTVQNTFTHELGHNFGIYHDRYSYNNSLSLTDPVNFPYKPYGFGYVNQNFSRSECHYTVMASGRQCIDEGYPWAVEDLMFSNPDLQLGSEEVGYDTAGVPGEEWTTDLDGPVNASRTIDEVWGIVADLYHGSAVGGDWLLSGDAELVGADRAELDLSDYFDARGALTYSATVDRPDLASVSVVGSILTVAANGDGGEGVVTVTATATDEAGRTATLRFAVTISPRPPGGWRGWRATLATPAGVRP